MKLQITELSKLIESLKEKELKYEESIGHFNVQFEDPYIMPSEVLKTTISICIPFTYDRYQNGLKDTGLRGLITDYI